MIGNKYGHKSVNDKGSKHPDDIGPGLQSVDKQGKTTPDVKKGYTKGGSKFRSGVVRGDGTETRRGTKVKKLQNKVSQPKASKDTSALPKGEGLHCYDGKSVPKSVK
jgi:hypothetical protein